MSFGTFDAEPALKSDSLPATPASPLLKAEKQIFFGLFNDVEKTLADSPDEETAHRVLDQLFGALRERKLNSTAPDWSEFVTWCRRHPVMNLLHQDPFTHRAFSKPRGYAGDAIMMDYIYGREEQWAPPETTPIGGNVFSFTTSAPASEGVRARRAYIATRIDRIAEEKRYPHILAIASGHLREASCSSAVRRRKTGRFIALDADAQSLTEVNRCYANYGVETVTASFRSLLTNATGVGEFDFAYSTGLFDYLNQRTARRLVTGMFQMLRPGGTLLVANFLPGIRDIGYMETFMDWKLVYRTRCDMVDLTMEIPEDDVKEVRVVSEDCRNIVFLQLTRN